MANKKPKILSARERKLVRALCSGKSLSEAAVVAGYSAKNPAQSGSQALAHLRDRIPEVMDRMGLSANSLINKYLVPALEAHETEFAKFEGKITDERDVIAWGPRLDALDMAFKLRGDYAQTKTENGASGIGQVNVQIINVGQ